MTNAVLDHCEELKERTKDVRSVTYTELARSRDWRSSLADEGVLRVSGARGNSEDAWIVSQSYMDSLLELIEQAELAYEREQITMMLEARSDYQNWMQGSELANAAIASFRERRDAFAEAFDGNI